MERLTPATEDAAFEVAKAWADPGRHPRWHNRVIKEIRHLAPTLAKALDKLANQYNIDKAHK